MDRLYFYLKESFDLQKTLIKIKKKVHEYINNDINKFCYSEAIFNFKKYNKIKLTEFSNDKFEIVLICWDEKSETLIHDHPNNGCVLY